LEEETALRINWKANKVRLGKTDTGNYFYNYGYLTMPACQDPKIRKTSEERNFLIHYGIAQNYTDFKKKKTQTQK